MNIGTVMIGLLIPFAGTAAGAACVFLLRSDLSEHMQRGLSGFAVGFSLMMALDVALG